MGQVLVVIGLFITGVGALIWAGVPLGRLPGDLVIRRDGFTFYLPIATCVLLSVALTLASWVWRR